MLTRIRHLFEMIRFSHTLFALPFALWAAVMAWTTMAGADAGVVELGETVGVGFRWRHLLGILVCMVCARSAAMAFNRLVDQHLDARNPRTRSRHLVTGTLNVRSVVFFTLVSGLGFVLGTLLFLPNRLPLYLCLPVLAFLLGYSYAKRFTMWAHFWLGAALMLAPISVWIAIRGQVLVSNPLDLLPSLLLGVGVLLWVAGFDIIYACLDVDFDARAGLHSIPAALGVVGALRVAAACHAGMIIVLVALSWLCPQLSLGWVFGLGVAAVAALLVYEHAIIRPDDLTRVNVAFFNVNVIVSLGLFAVGTLDLLT